MAKVAIVGCGFIGRAWAISFARAGHEIALWDADPTAPAAALAYIDTVLPDLAANDLLNDRTPAEIRARLRSCVRIEDALAEAIPGDTTGGRLLLRSRARYVAAAPISAGAPAKASDMVRSNVRPGVGIISVSACLIGHLAVLCDYVTDPKTTNDPERVSPAACLGICSGGTEFQPPITRI